MSKKKPHAPLIEETRPTSPVFPTSLVGKVADGRLLGEDGSVWAYYSIPKSPMADAKTVEGRLDSGLPLYSILTELANTVRTVGPKKRKVQKNKYRAYHLHMISIDTPFTPPRDNPLSPELSREFADMVTMTKSTILGVRLEAKLLSRGVKGALDSVVDTFRSARAPMEEYDDDFQRVTTIMNRYGASICKGKDLLPHQGWYSNGRAQDLYYMSTPECIHFFSNSSSARRGEELYTSKTPPEEWPHLLGHHAVSMAVVTDFTLPMVEASTLEGTWVSNLVDSNAMCVSITGLLEPGVITAKEIDANIKTYEHDITQREEFNKSSTPEQEEKLATLAQMRELYIGRNAAPTSTHTSIVVGFAGDGSDLEDLVIPTVDCASMFSRQVGALAETWLCPSVKVNPNLHDLPLTTLAFSGITELSVVGDPPTGAVMSGLTEKDRQVVWTHAGAAMRHADAPPLVLIAGASGSGKTMVGVRHAVEFAQLGHRVVFVNPKEDSYFAPLFDAYGGFTADLGNLLSSDGVLDPLRVFGQTDVKEAVKYSVNILKMINPWGAMGVNVETSLYACLNHGVSRGARSILTALDRAALDGVEEATDALIRPIVTVAQTVPMAAALIGHTDIGPRIAFDNDLNLVEMGSARLDLPTTADPREMTISERVTISLLRMLVRASTIAVREGATKEGIVLLDEAWIFFDSAGSELVSLGRLARSMDVAVWLMTQRVSDVNRASLDDFISTGMILAMANEIEAQAACKLLRLQPTPERISRMLAKGISEGGSGEEVAFNYNSLKALIHPVTREVRRGSVALYADISDRAVYVEIPIPHDFLALASTNKIDRERQGRR